MLGITLTKNEKLGLAAGVGVLAVAALAPAFFGGADDAPAPVRRAEKRLESAQRKRLRADAIADRQIKQAEAAGQKARERMDRAEDTVKKRLGKLRDRSDDVADDLASAQQRADSAMSRKAAASAQHAVKAKKRQFDRLMRDIDETEADLERVRRGDSRVLAHVRNPDTLSDARADSAEFHGTPGQVIRLSEAERCAPSEFQTVVGTLEALSYRTPAGTIRHDAIRDHRFGDGGILGQSSQRPILIEDPETHQIGIYRGDAPTTFSPEAGILF